MSAFLFSIALQSILDDYKARCIAAELTDVPLDLARTVVDVLEEDMGSSPSALRLPDRSGLSSPDLLRERTKRRTSGPTLGQRPGTEH